MQMKIFFRYKCIHDEFYKKSKEVVPKMSCNSFEKLVKEGMPPNMLHTSSIKIDIGLR